MHVCDLQVHVYCPLWHTWHDADGYFLCLLDNIPWSKVQLLRGYISTETKMNEASLPHLGHAQMVTLDERLTVVVEVRPGLVCLVQACQPHPGMHIQQNRAWPSQQEETMP